MVAHTPYGHCHTPLLPLFSSLASSLPIFTGSLSRLQAVSTLVLPAPQPFLRMLCIERQHPLRA